MTTYPSLPASSDDGVSRVADPGARSEHFPQIPTAVLAEMANAMIEPSLTMGGVTNLTGLRIRINVLERALLAAARHGWVLTHV